MDLVEESKAKATGIISIFIGITAFIDLVCGFIYLSKGGPDGSGVWTGFGLAVITVLGILVWIKRNKAVMIFYMVMCILWVIVCIVQVIIALIAWLVWNYIRKLVEFHCHESGDKCICDTDKQIPVVVHNCNDIKVIESCFLAILLMSAFAVILTLAGSILGCIATCCAKPQPAGVVVVQQPGVIQTAYPGQPMMIVQQTHMAQPQYPQPQYSQPPVDFQPSAFAPAAPPEYPQKF